MINGMSLVLWAMLALGPAGAQDPTGMELLATTAGEWEVEVVEASGRAYKGRSLVVAIQDGLLQQESMRLPSSPMNPGAGVTIVGLRSYDAFRRIYRFAYHDSLTGLLDIYEGGVEEGRLVLTNLETGTSLRLPDGREAHTRITAEIGVRGYVVTLESSIDGGATWTPVMTSTYRPAQARG